MSKLVGYVSTFLPEDNTYPVGYGGLGALEINPSVLFPTRPKPSPDAPVEGPKPTPHWVWIAGSAVAVLLLITTTVALAPWAGGKGK